MILNPAFAPRDPIMHSRRFQMSSRRWMVVIAMIALLLMRTKPELSRRWNACQVTSQRHTREAEAILARARDLESQADQLSRLVRGEVSPEATEFLLVPGRAEGGMWSSERQAARFWEDVLRKQAALDREKATLHRERADYIWWLFFDPWEPCIPGPTFF